MGVGSAPGSVILSVDRSHKGKSVTIQLCREIPGWLVPPPMVDDHATPQRQASKRGPWSRGATRSAGWAQQGQENPKTGKQRALTCSQYNTVSSSNKAAAHLLCNSTSAFILCQTLCSAFYII